MATKNVFKKRESIFAKKNNVKAPVSTKKSNLTQKARSILFGIFSGVAPTEVRQAVVLDFSTHKAILEKKKSQLEQEKGTLNRPSKIKELNKDVGFWKNEIAEDKTRIKFLAKKHNFDAKLILKLK